MTTLRFACLVLSLSIAACTQRLPAVGYEGYVIPGELQLELQALQGLPFSLEAIGSEPFGGWRLFQAEGFFVGPEGPQAVMQKPGGVVLAFPIRRDADARAYMRLFGVQSVHDESEGSGETSPEFDAMCSRFNLPVRR